MNTEQSHGWFFSFCVYCNVCVPVGGGSGAPGGRSRFRATNWLLVNFVCPHTPVTHATHSWCLVQIRIPGTLLTSQKISEIHTRYQTQSAVHGTGRVACSQKKKLTIAGEMTEKRMSRWYFGGIASCGAACCTHPLDLVKVRRARESRCVRVSVDPHISRCQAFGGGWWVCGWMLVQVVTHQRPHLHPHRKTTTARAHDMTSVWLWEKTAQSSSFGELIV